ncbi:unnamed protein product [Adineta steineri]|uniref:RNase III domain-containing protein n=1 Tax=Adineta steineri TaxID=433720 RepID=A0A815H2N9_9BILA|nr:unnamed protein product [Adineta steineri]CAF1409365.1 unnamed protein product [Adineta steineri]
MAWSHQGYAAAGFGIPFGLGIVVFAVLFSLIRWCPRTFYRMIKAMFSIKHYEGTSSDAREFIDIYGVQISLSATTFSFLPPLALLIMATAVLTATFVLFLSELFLIGRYVSPNSKCPSDDEMDCYTTVNSTYFYCNSSDTRIDASLGSLVCYRWIKQNIETVEILNQIGLCGGLLQAFGWFVNIFLRLLLHVLQRKKSSPSERIFTHASYSYNTITDCYQYLEFLGNTVLDYVIIRYLYEVIITIERMNFFIMSFLTSSVSNNKDTYSNTMSCTIDNEYLSNSHDEQKDETTNEPDECGKKQKFQKCLGDIFLDSNKSFNTVWKIYYRMLKPFIEKFTTKVPKSPIRKLLEPETVAFEKSERLL